MGKKRGEFNIKSAYYIAFGVLETMDEGESSSGDPRSPLWKKLWHLNIPSKMRIFAWKMFMNALPTLVNLQIRGVNVGEICLACGKEPELIIHALVRCEVAKRVWDCWMEGLVDLLNENMDAMDIAMKISEFGTSRDLEIFFGVAWSVWYNRNKIMHESSCQLPNHIWNFAKRYIQEFKSASTVCSQQLPLSEKKWIAPPPGVFKINVDGATSKNERNSRVGVVIRDATGLITAICCKYLQG